jgi:FtsP/CotA-like multicopper oxidase with cupredoxin domain
MYHAHHMGQEQVPNGLAGTLLIGDMPIPRGRTISGVTVPEDLQLTAEVPMVLNDAGVIGLSLNGKSFPATDPFVWKVGSWVLVHYLNEGLLMHPMHQPYFADTLAVAPGERYSVLMHVDRPGTWVWHCHILTHVERATGMFGMATAIVAEP